MSVGAIAGAKAVEGLASNKATPYVIGGIILVGAVGSFLIIRKILQKLNVVDDADDRKADRLTVDEAFDPIHSRNKPSKVTISTSKANKLAKDIVLSSGYYTEAFGKIISSYGNDDEEKLFGAIRSAGTTYNLSKIADVMYKTYNIDLLSHLRDFLSSSELVEVKKIIKQYKS